MTEKLAELVTSGEISTYEAIALKLAELVASGEMSTYEAIAFVTVQIIAATISLWMLEKVLKN